MIHLRRSLGALCALSLSLATPLLAQSATHVVHTSFTDAGATLTSVSVPYVISGSLSLNIGPAGNGQGAYLTGAAAGSLHTITVTPDNTTVATFELAGLVFDEYFDNNNFQVWVVGTKPDNTTVTSNTVAGTGTGGSTGGGTGPDTYAVSLANFVGVQLKSFTVHVNGATHAGAAFATNPTDFSLVSFTTANEQAPDTTPPEVTGVTASTADGAYNAGDSISIQVSFSENVTVTGTPQLTLETGTTDRVINYVSGSGGSTLTFNYTVQAGDTSADLDYVSTSALGLNGGSIRDGAGNNATLTLATPGAANSLGANKAIIIDTTAPAISIGEPSVSVTKSGPVSFTVSYSDSHFGAVSLTPGNITLNTTGSASATIDVSGSGTSRTVTLSSIIGDGSLGISIAAGTATDLAGNTAPAAGPSTTFTVDNTAPAVTSSLSASGTYGAALNYTITASGSPVSYNAANLPAGLSVNTGTGVISGVLAQTGVVNATISATDAVGNIGSATLTFTIAKAAATVTLGDLTATYDGGSHAASATTTPGGLTVTFTYDGSGTAPVNAGSYEVVGTINDDNYQGSASGTLVIAKAALTVSADPQVRAYGFDNPELTASVTGFVNGETTAVLSGAPELSTEADASSVPGDYDITVALGTLSATNYSFALVDGVLTVTTQTIDDWRADNFDSVDLLDPLISGPDADPDLDGVSNLFEYAFGTDPNDIASGPLGLQYDGTLAGGVTLVETGAPVRIVEVVESATTTRVLFVRRKSAFTSDLEYTAQFSFNGSAWSDAEDAPTVLADSGLYELVSVSYPLTTAGKKTRFFRVVAELVP